MKTFKHLIFALIASLLLTAGLATAAESFDMAAKNSAVELGVHTNPSLPCIIEH